MILRLIFSIINLIIAFLELIYRILEFFFDGTFNLIAFGGGLASIGYIIFKFVLKSDNQPSILQFSDVKEHLFKLRGKVYDIFGFRWVLGQEARRNLRVSFQLDCSRNENLKNTEDKIQGLLVQQVESDNENANDDFKNGKDAELYEFDPNSSPEEILKIAKRIRIKRGDGALKDRIQRWENFSNHYAQKSLPEE